MPFPCRRAAAGLLTGILAGTAACSSDAAPPGAVPAASTATRSATTSATASPSSPSPSPTPAPVPPGTSPFTGRAIGARPGPVVVVKIDNTGEARPISGLDAADVVYIEPVEAGITRLAAVFAGTLPGRVGPVRSGRDSDIELVAQYGRVVFAYSGAQRTVLRRIAKAPLYDLNEETGGTAFWRDFSRYAPYNLFASARRLANRAPKAARPQDVGFRFGPAPAGGRRATSVTATWQRATSTFRWSAPAKRWLWEMDGRAQRAADGKRLGASSVLIQNVRITPSAFRDVNGHRSPDIATVGSGTGLLLRDGKAFPVTWSRASAAKPTRWTLAGKDATLAVGQTWVVLLDRRTPAKLR